MTENEYVRSFGVTVDYEYTETHKRSRIQVWEGPWWSVFVADGLSLPGGDGYMLTTYNGDKVRVTCPVVRTDDNYEPMDRAINDALVAHFSQIASLGDLLAGDEGEQLYDEMEWRRES